MLAKKSKWENENYVRWWEYITYKVFGTMIALIPLIFSEILFHDSYISHTEYSSFLNNVQYILSLKNILLRCMIHTSNIYMQIMYYSSLDSWEKYMTLCMWVLYGRPIINEETIYLYVWCLLSLWVCTRIDSIPNFI